MRAIMLILWKLILYMFGKYFRVFSSISEIRTSSEHERTKNDIFELWASTNSQFSERERANIERFEVRHNTKSGHSNGIGIRSPTKKWEFSLYLRLLLSSISDKRTDNILDLVKQLLGRELNRHFMYLDEINKNKWTCYVTGSRNLGLINGLKTIILKCNANKPHVQKNSLQ